MNEEQENTKIPEQQQRSLNESNEPMRYVPWLRALLVDEPGRFFFWWLYKEPALVQVPLRVRALGGFREDSANHTPGIYSTKMSTRR